MQAQRAQPEENGPNSPLPKTGKRRPETSKKVGNQNSKTSDDQKASENSPSTPRSQNSLLQNRSSRQVDSMKSILALPTIYTFFTKEKEDDDFWKKIGECIKKEVEVTENTENGKSKTVSKSIKRLNSGDIALLKPNDKRQVLVIKLWHILKNDDSLYEQMAGCKLVLQEFRITGDPFLFSLQSFYTPPRQVQDKSVKYDNFKGYKEHFQFLLKHQPPDILVDFNNADDIYGWAYSNTKTPKLTVWACFLCCAIQMSSYILLQTLSLADKEPRDFNDRVSIAKVSALGCLIAFLIQDFWGSNLLLYHCIYSMYYYEKINVRIVFPLMQLATVAFGFKAGIGGISRADNIWDVFDNVVAVAFIGEIDEWIVRQIVDDVKGPPLEPPVSEMWWRYKLDMRESSKEFSESSCNCSEWFTCFKKYLWPWVTILILMVVTLAVTLFGFLIPSYSEIWEKPDKSEKDVSFWVYIVLTFIILPVVLSFLFNCIDPRSKQEGNSELSEEAKQQLDLRSKMNEIKERINVIMETAKKNVDEHKKELDGHKKELDGHKKELDGHQKALAKLDKEKREEWPPALQHLYDLAQTDLEAAAKANKEKLDKLAKKLEEMEEKQPDDKANKKDKPTSTKPTPYGNNDQDEAGEENVESPDLEDAILNRLRMAESELRYRLDQDRPDQDRPDQDRPDQDRPDQDLGINKHDIENFTIEDRLMNIEAHLILLELSQQGGRGNGARESYRDKFLRATSGMHHKIANAAMVAVQLGKMNERLESLENAFPQFQHKMGGDEDKDKSN